MTALRATAIRYGQATGLAALVTFGLFFLMPKLIETGRSALEDAPSGTVVDFVRARKDEIIQKKERKPPRPPVPEDEPPKPSQPRRDYLNPSGDSLNVASVGVDADISLESGLGFGGVSDGEYLPIVKVAPIYPRRAQARGIEGYVIVEFVVTAAGTVDAPVIIDSVPPGIFDRAALQAVAKFKYKPKVINGKPVAVAGVRNKLTFILED